MAEENNKANYAEERELLHKQFKLLAEKSKECPVENLAEISEQMIAIYHALYSPNF